MLCIRYMFSSNNDVYFLTGFSRGKKITKRARTKSTARDRKISKIKQYSG